MAARTFGPCLTTSKPATRARPSVGGSSVVSMCTVVDLPAPFGPEEAVDLAFGDDEVDAVHGADVLELADEPLRLDAVRHLPTLAGRGIRAAR